MKLVTFIFLLSSFPYIGPNDPIGLSIKLPCLIIKLLLEKATAAKRKKLRDMIA